MNVIRFLGTTPSSFDIRQLLQSLCRQIFITLDRDPELVPSSIKELQNLFNELLEKFPDKKNLVIFLDSLDMLVPQYNAHFLQWLPEKLKENVKIVLSTLPDKHGILERLQKDLVQEDEYFLEVGAMSVEECTKLLSCWLSSAGRCLSSLQQSAVQGVFQLCALPLYVKLLAEDAKSWTSHSFISPVMLPTNVKDYLNSFFDGLEFKHGTTLVSKALSYITASTTGLSDCEMEDILSLDEDVLNEVYKDCMPSSRRIPSLIWIRLKADLSNFLMRKLSEDISVYFWFHRQFVEATRIRYLADEQSRKEIHTVLADYFLGSWYNKKKPFTRQISPSDPQDKPSVKLDEADRLVCSQPMTFPSEDGTKRYNKRKYEQVPRHLYLSGRLQELNSIVLFSYEWIYSKMISLSLEHVLADFVLNPGIEATLVERALRDAQHFLLDDPNSLAAELSGRLLSYYPTNPLIRGLVEDCDTAGFKHCALLPAFSYHQVPGSPLKYSLPCLGKPTQFAMVGEQSRYLLVKQSNSSILQKFDLATGEHMNDIIVSFGEMKVSPNGQYVVLVEHQREKAIKVHDSETGMFLGQLIPSNHIKVEEKPTSPWKMTDVSISDTHICAIVTTEESTLCVADISTCDILSVIGLGGRSSICQINPSSSHVFCSSQNTLLCFDLEEYEQVGQTEVEAKPSKLVLSGVLSRGYLSNALDNKLYVLHIVNGVTDFVYKVDLKEHFANDSICDMKLSNSQKMLLVIGQNNLVIYNTSKDSVTCRMPRPTDIPKEFKLPKAHQPTEIFYTEAEFSPDDRFVMASIFRNVYVWEADTGRMLTQLQAPVGIVRQLLVPSDRGQIITHMDNAEDIQIWSLGDAISHVGSLDRLTASVSDVVVTSDDKLAYVMCEGSDEVGVLDLQTGKLIDLLTHENPVTSVSISKSGNMAIIATQPKKASTCNKIWNIKDRQMLYEFGNMPSYTIPMTAEDKVICVYQQDNLYKSPFEVVMFDLNDEEVNDFRWPQSMPFVISKPFLTPEDKYLVVLTADDFDVTNASYVNPTICSISMQDGMSCTRFKLCELIDNVVIRRILHVRPYSKNPYTVIVIFTSEPDDFSSGVNQKYDHCYGFLILDVCSGILCQVIKDFLTPDTAVEKILFNSDASICLDDKSNLFEMATGDFVKTVHPEEAQPSLLALDGQLAVYYRGSTLSAVRLSDCKTLGSCDVHSEISCLNLCHDDRTVVVGCKDGSLLAYVLINEESDDVRTVLQSVASRQVAPKPKPDVIQTRVWDKVNGTTSCPPYSRPTSAVSLGPTDRQLLKKVKPLARFRPTSDTLLYMNPRSKTCSVM